MHKKFTLKEATEVLSHYNISKVTEQILSNINLVPDIALNEMPILAYEFYRDGRTIQHCYCPECGEEFEREKPYGYWGYRAFERDNNCPKCNHTGIRTIRTGVTIPATNRYSLILEVDKERGYLVFADFRPYYTYRLDEAEVNACIEAGNFDFLKKDYEKSENIDSPDIGIFFMDKGIRFYCDGERLESPASGTHESELTYFYNSVLLDKNTAEANTFLTENGCDTSNGLINAMIKVVNKLDAEKRAKKTVKRPRKVKVESSAYKDYKANPISKQDIIKAGARPIELLKSEIGNKKTFLKYCPHCGAVSEGEHSETSFICPACKKEVEIPRNFYSRHGTEATHEEKVQVYELMRETNDLILRIFSVTETLHMNKKMEFTVYEAQRIFFTPKKIFGFQGFEHSPLTRMGAYGMDDGQYSQQLLMQEPEEIKKIIDESVLKYSGLAEAWGLTGGTPLESVGTHHRRSYLYNWYKKPFMEQLLKTGLFKATRDVLGMDMESLSRYIDVEGTTVYSILRITKPVFKIARKMNLGCRDILYLKRLWELDNTITEDVFNEIRVISNGSIDAVYDIASRYSIPFAKIIEYIKSCYNNQCIPNNEALRLWSDYLSMAKDMTYRLDNKNTKFPPSLKKEHDRATFAYRVVQDEMNKKRFVEQAKENLKYEYSYEKLFVKVPQTPEEIIEEGTNQKHCVASYVNRVREGDTVVAFIRFKETPNESYFTIEIKNDVIIQVKGYTNCAPTDKRLLEFLSKYATAKKLKLRY